MSAPLWTPDPATVRESRVYPPINLLRADIEQLRQRMDALEGRVYWLLCAFLVLVFCFVVVAWP
jgi:hypothetical protein